MNWGGKAALLISAAGLGGCSASMNAVKVRPLADPSAALRNGDAVAAARGQLMIGNVGLALEGFRKAQRDNPTDPAALAGIADCYSAMSRYDLAQSNYEAALALAPHDPRLLLGLASAFEHEGKIASAMAARAEATAASQSAPSVPKQAAAVAPAVQVPAAPLVTQRAEVVPPPAKAEEAPAPLHWADATPPQVRIQAAPLVTKLEAALAISVPLMAPEVAKRVAAAVMPAPAPQPAAKPVIGVGSITVALPPARPVEHFEMHAAPLKVAQVQYDYSRVPSSVTMPQPRPAEHFEMHAAPLKVAEAQYDYSHLSSSVTVQLPPARPAEAPAPLPAPKPMVATMVAEATGPRLERLSRGEVALVTTGKPIWSPQKDVQMASTGSVRWVSLASLNSKPNVQILNAARTNLLAASARTVLLDRGWRKIVVGDARAVRLKSEVQYPKNQATLGRRLAAQFGVAARMVERDVIVLVLGRDAVDRIARPQKS